MSLYNGHPQLAHGGLDRFEVPGIPALEKGLAVLELLAGAREPMSLNAHSRQAQRSVSELFRMIQDFRVSRLPGRYPTRARGMSYSGKLFALGACWPGPLPKTYLMSPYPSHAPSHRQDWTKSCHLVVASGDQMVVVARVEAPGDLGFFGASRLPPCFGGFNLWSRSVCISSRSGSRKWKTRLSARCRQERLKSSRKSRGHAARGLGS